MEKYKIRKGTVLLDIHGAYLLAADEQARKHHTAEQISKIKKSIRGK